MVPEYTKLPALAPFFRSVKELAGIVIPVKLSAVAPDVKVPGVVPVQEPPTAPPAAVIFTRLSVNAPPDSAVALLLDRVSVTVDVPPDGIVVGLKDLEMVGGAR